MANSPERIPIKPPIVTFHTAENKWICLKLNSMLHIVQAFQDKNYISVHVIQFLISSFGHDARRWLFYIIRN